MNANFAIRLTFHSIFTIVVVVVSILGIWSTVIANGSNTQSGSVSDVRYTAEVGTSTVSAGGWNGYVEATAASSITDVGLSHCPQGGNKNLMSKNRPKAHGTFYSLGTINVNTKQDDNPFFLINRYKPTRYYQQP